MAALGAFGACLYRRACVDGAKRKTKGRGGPSRFAPICFSSCLPARGIVATLIGGAQRALCGAILFVIGTLLFSSFVLALELYLHPDGEANREVVAMRSAL